VGEKKKEVVTPRRMKVKRSKGKKKHAALSNEMSQHCNAGAGHHTTLKHNIEREREIRRGENVGGEGALYMLR
jgi:hypothetical protein